MYYPNITLFAMSGVSPRNSVVLVCLCVSVRPLHLRLLFFNYYDFGLSTPVCVCVCHPRPCVDPIVPPQRTHLHQCISTRVCLWHPCPSIPPPSTYVFWEISLTTPPPLMPLVFVCDHIDILQHTHAPIPAHPLVCFLELLYVHVDTLHVIIVYCLWCNIFGGM